MLPSPRARRRILLALLAAAGAYLALLAAARSAPAERFLRARIHGALRARLGDVAIGEDLRVDPIFRVRFGPVEIPARARAATTPTSPGTRSLASSSAASPSRSPSAARRSRPVRWMRHCG